MDETHTLAVTNDNTLQLLENGNPIAQNKDFDKLIGGLAVQPNHQGIYVGLANGSITALDAALQTPHEIAKLDGRIVDMQSLGERGYLVGYGIGPYSNRYWVEFFSWGAAQPTFKTQVEFTITDIDALPNTTSGTVYYGTSNGKIGAIDITTGTKLWAVTGTRRVTHLLALSDDAASKTTGQVLVGDERGTLRLLSKDGATIWDASPTEWEIRSLAYEPVTHTFLVGDGHGGLFALDTMGKLLQRRQIADSEVLLLAPLGKSSLLAAPRSGNWTTVNAGALDAAQALNSLSDARLIFDVGLLAALLAALILTINRLRLATARLLRRAWLGRMGYLLILPAVVLIIVWNYIPSLMAIYYSLTDFSTRNAVTQFIGLDNYHHLLTADSYFGRGFSNVLILTIANMFKAVSVPLLVAELIFWIRSSQRRFIFRTLFLIPAVVPALIAVYMWQMVYDPYDGLLNNILKLFTGIFPHLPTQQAWLADDKTFILSVVFAGFPFVSAFPLLIYMGGLLNISSELFDAARIDGASWWARFWKVDFPLLMPQTRILLFFAFSGSISGFADILIYSNNNPSDAMFVPGLQMYRSISQGDFGYAAAVGSVLFVMVLVGTFIILRARRTSILDTV